MNKELKRLERLCSWLTNWLAKSECEYDDGFYPSAVKAYEHFLDLAAKEYEKDYILQTHSLEVVFHHYEMGNVLCETSIYLNMTNLRIEYRESCYKYRGDDSSKIVEMHWRDDEIGKVVFEGPDFTETEEHSFNEVLDMFDGDKRTWLLDSLRICYSEREAITYCAM